MSQQGFSQPFYQPLLHSGCSVTLRAAISPFSQVRKLRGAACSITAHTFQSLLTPWKCVSGPCHLSMNSRPRESRLLEKVSKTDCAGEDPGIEEIRMRIYNAISRPASRRKTQAETPGSQREKTGFLSVPSGLFPVNNQQQ